MDILSRFRKSKKQERIEKKPQGQKKGETQAKKTSSFRVSEQKKATVKPQEKKKEQKVLMEDSSKTEKTVVSTKAKSSSVLFPNILKFPHITEKASDLEKQNQYIFKVFKNANKTEVKKAIENFYNVKVIQVRIINIPEKQKRLGRTLGHIPGYKKAIVKLKQGQSIEILPH